MTARKITKVARCKVCAHPERARIEFGKVSGASLDSLALQFGVSRDAIHRHCLNHLSDDDRAIYLAEIPMRDLAAKAAEESVSVLQYFSIIRGVLMSQFQLANSINDRQGVATLAGKLTDTLRAIANLTGEMASLANSSINITNNTLVMNSPMMVTLQASILQALAPYADARTAVIQALRHLDEQQEPDQSAMKVIEHAPQTIDGNKN
jgi:hypothetical protein